MDRRSLVKNLGIAGATVAAGALAACGKKEGADAGASGAVKGAPAVQSGETVR